MMDADFTTPAGVAYQTPTGVNSLRDRCRGRKIGNLRQSGGLALRARPPATVRNASGVDISDHIRNAVGVDISGSDHERRSTHLQRNEPYPDAAIFLTGEVVPTES